MLKSMNVRNVKFRRYYSFLIFVSQKLSKIVRKITSNFFQENSTTSYIRNRVYPYFVTYLTPYFKSKQRVSFWTRENLTLSQQAFLTHRVKKKFVRYKSTLEEVSDKHWLESVIVYMVVAER